MAGSKPGFITEHLRFEFIHMNHMEKVGSSSLSASVGYETGSTVCRCQKMNTFALKSSNPGGVGAYQCGGRSCCGILRSCGSRLMTATGMRGTCIWGLRICVSRLRGTPLSGTALSMTVVRVAAITGIGITATAMLATVILAAMPGLRIRYGEDKCKRPGQQRENQNFF